MGEYRRELKYFLPRTDFCRLRPRLEAIIGYDPHGGAAGYTVRSLYFDSVWDGDLYDALDGNHSKRKVRLRTYAPDAGRMKLECKCKEGSDGIKRSLSVSRQEARGMLKGDYLFLRERPEPLGMELYTRMITGGYTAKVVVEYQRLAFVYPVSNVRITYDTGTAASYCVEGFFAEKPVLTPVLAPDVGILEVKYDDFLPGVIKGALSGIDSSPAANSKYAVSRLIV